MVRRNTLGMAVLTVLASSASVFAAESSAPKETPLSMVNALHTAFGEHHARAVHTKGVILVGTFTPGPAATAITRAPVFASGTLPIVARFSLFAGVPDLADNADGASPAGFGIKIKTSNGDDFDIEANQHGNFIVATFDEFAVFLRALAASGPQAAHPTQVEQFLASHPKAAEFLASRTYPASYAQATYFGINALKFTNAHAESVFVRYRIVPRSAEHYLTPAERKSQTTTYLQDEIVQRVARQPVLFDWYAQVAERGDPIEDPSTAWPDSRKQVKLGTFALTAQPSNPEIVDKELLFLPGQPHPGVEPADPMLILRNAAYPISLGQRQ
jgi:catalase